jgi:hypothetical protein
MMDTQRVEIRAQPAPWWNGIALCVSRKEGERSREHISEVVFREYGHAERVDTTFVLSHIEAQVLMDDLWASGLRPTEGSGSAGALRATEKHLKDMRQIVFQFLGKIVIRPADE